MASINSVLSVQGDDGSLNLLKDKATAMAWVYDIFETFYERFKALYWLRAPCHADEIADYVG